MVFFIIIIISLEDTEGTLRQGFLRDFREAIGDVERAVCSLEILPKAVEALRFVTHVGPSRIRELLDSAAKDVQVHA